jgi:hypothetical protein
LPVCQLARDAYEDLHKLVAFARATFRHPFSSKEIRGPIISAAEESGWEWVPVTARRHATYESHEVIYILRLTQAGCCIASNFVYAGSATELNLYDQS